MGAAVAALTLALAACGGSESGGDGKVTLTLLDYYTAGGGKTAVDAYIRTFESKHPNVDVRRQSVPFENLMPKVLQAASAGDMPDIVIIDNPNLQQVAATGQLRAFDDLPGYTTQGYYEGAIKECEFKGRHYCYPVGSNSVGLFYNKKMLDDAGIKPPTTWAELTDAAARLTKPPTYGIAVSAPADEQSTWQLEPFAWSGGGGMTQVDSPPWVQALRLWTGWAEKGYMSKSVLQWDQSPELPQQFLQKKAAMMINGPWIFPLLNEAGWKYNQDYGIAKVPVQRPGQKVVAPLGGETWTLGDSGNGAQKKWAWEFVKGTQEPAVMQQLTKEMYIVPTKPAVTAEFLKGGEEYAVFAEQSLTARPRTTEYGANYPKVSQAVWTAIQAALTGTKTPEEALKEAQQTVGSVPRQQGQ
ncbi:sugar ABC transporter substrate-binding protein [Actinomadura sp. NBRC 104412]|uniref:ABC transporter substrate-binding protein n=1 Tax=Actinomadura sp. NBRC 104412 TaxID=3032203 RepID=UPI0024A182CA|nr:extracellular solute-binding protein [Actinomadura sp. NBRC 104412]GLZ05675.1 sugar ABC transporter substrate-binding protein [Actinomadura sp. NBRC 104412]